MIYITDPLFMVSQKQRCLKILARVMILLLRFPPLCYISLCLKCSSPFLEAFFCFAASVQCRQTVCVISMSEQCQRNLSCGTSCAALLHHSAHLMVHSTCLIPDAGSNMMFFCEFHCLGGNLMQLILVT